MEGRINLVSFSLWGDAPRYVQGAIRNAEVAPGIYPGWTCRFYCGASVPGSALDRLATFPHVRLVRRAEPGDWTSMFWRFEAAADPNAEAIVFRDTDSRLSPRERAAVDSWLASGADAHVMRDHPYHNVPMLGGLWGVRGGILAGIEADIAGYVRRNYWQIDQEFLAAVIAPRLRSGWIEHDEYFAHRPFPTARRGREFVGQPFDEHDRPLMFGPTALERRIRQAARALRLRVLGS
jgi:hypothetical protein